MRREGYELQVSPPHVLTHEENGKVMEPMERVVIDVPEVYQGNVMTALGARKAILMNMQMMNSRSRIRFQMVACAFVEICWPTMWCTTAEKRSVSTSLSMCPACAMTAAIRSSLALRYVVSASPYWKYICPAFFLYNLSFAHQLLI